MKKVDIETLCFNPFDKIGEEWMLVTAGDKEKANTMTASWGTMGILWNRKTITVFVRPSRLTKQFLDNNEYFSISFFKDEYRKILGYLGSISGRVENKIEKSGLKLIEIDNTVGFEEASLTFICRKMYHDKINEVKMSQQGKPFYPRGDYHEVYIGEIVSVYEK